MADDLQWSLMVTIQNAWRSRWYLNIQVDRLIPHTEATCQVAKLAKSHVFNTMSAASSALFCRDPLICCLSAASVRDRPDCESPEVGLGPMSTSRKKQENKSKTKLKLPINQSQQPIKPIKLSNNSQVSKFHSTKTYQPTSSPGHHPQVVALAMPWPRERPTCRGAGAARCATRAPWAAPGRRSWPPWRGDRAGAPRSARDLRPCSPGRGGGFGGLVQEGVW